MKTRDPVAYEAACAHMAQRTRDIADGRTGELVWLLEHPPLYTAGTSARPEDLLAPSRFPVYRTGRGGQFTYHGPGQRVVYLMLDVRRRFGDVRTYVSTLEDWIIDALARFNVRGEKRQGRVGVWVRRPGSGGHDKVAAIGVRLSRWVSSHGVSINIACDLGHYDGIIPCGVRDGGVTSLANLGLQIAMEEFDEALRTTFEFHFGTTEDAPSSRGAMAPA